MTDYQPADEQIAVFAKHSVGHDWVFFDERMRTWEMDKARREITSPAFQAIIRAAQADAWGEGVTHLSQTIGAPIAYDAAVFTDNPYREAADV